MFSPRQTPYGEISVLNKDVMNVVNDYFSVFDNVFLETKKNPKPYVQVFSPWRILDREIKFSNEDVMSVINNYFVEFGEAYFFNKKKIETLDISFVLIRQYESNIFSEPLY